MIKKLLLLTLTLFSSFLVHAQVTTGSGTNELHGSVFGFNQNQSFAGENPAGEPYSNFSDWNFLTVFAQLMPHLFLKCGIIIFSYIFVHLLPYVNDFIINRPKIGPG